MHFVPIDRVLRNDNIIRQEAINCVWANSPDIYTPTKLCPTVAPSATFDFQQIAMPMVHPKTREIISNYKQLMHDPVTAKIWQTAFGKDFGSMVQGDLRQGRKGQT